MYLLDTNIFSEILLDQDKSHPCKEFIVGQRGNLYISDFSLHSIGVILFRMKKHSLFGDFVNDILKAINIVTLPQNLYPDLSAMYSDLNLDFDDIYQYSVARHYDLKIVTMDSDFSKIKDVPVMTI